MKKIVLILVAGILLAGCGIETETKKEETKKEETKTDVLTSIRDAVNKQLILRCDYTDTDGQTTTTYIKGNMVRMRGTGKEVNVEGLMRDNKFYLWDAEKKQGMEMDMAKLAEGGTAKMGDKPVKSAEDVVAVLEENKQKCSFSPESGAMFDVPTEVKFMSSENLFGGLTK